MTPAQGASNSKAFTTFSSTPSYTPGMYGMWEDLNYVDLRYDFNTEKKAMDYFDKNEWQSEICPANIYRFLVTSCSYLDGDESMNCR